VRVGHEDASAAIILDGVKPGERVVTDGASRVSEGSRVTIAQPIAAGAARAR
jgi:multidrug efflux system membrane fusion protein